MSHAQVYFAQNCAHRLAFSIADYVFHPAVMDAAVHVVAHPLLTGNYDRDVYHLPDKVATFRTYPRLRESPFPEVLYAKATTVSWCPGMYTSHEGYTSR